MTKLSSNPPSLANAFLTLVQGDETLQIIGWLESKTWHCGINIFDSFLGTLPTFQDHSWYKKTPVRPSPLHREAMTFKINLLTWGTNPTWFWIYPDTTNVTTDTTIISDNSFEQQFYSFRQQWTRTTNNNHHSNKKKKNSNNRNNNKKKKKKKKKKQQQQEQQPKKSSHFKLLLCWFSISPPGPSCAKRMSPSTTVGGSLSWRNIRDYPKS